MGVCGDIFNTALGPWVQKVPETLQKKEKKEKKLARPDVHVNPLLHSRTMMAFRAVLSAETPVRLQQDLKVVPCIPTN